MGVRTKMDSAGKIFVPRRWLTTLWGQTGIGLFSGMILTPVLLTGCTMPDMKMTMGTFVNVAALEGPLCVGKSTQVDVLSILGPPTGEGRAMLPIHTTTKTVWTYWYEKGSVNVSSRILLFVFFDEDRYGGYMWASTLPEHKGSRGWDASQEEQCP